MCRDGTFFWVVGIKQIDGTNAEKAPSRDSLGLQQDDV